MAEVQAKDNGGKEKGKQKKMTIRVDFTPMVDMNMLLITFFMLCTSLSKPQTMEISMPSNDKVTEEEQNKVQASRAITVILGGDNQLFYYTGEPNYEDYNSLKETSYEADGLRELLLNRNREVVTEMNQLKKDKAEHKLTEEQYDEKVKELRENLSDRDDQGLGRRQLQEPDRRTRRNADLQHQQVCDRRYDRRRHVPVGQPGKQRRADQEH